MWAKHYHLEDMAYPEFNIKISKAKVKSVIRKCAKNFDVPMPSISFTNDVKHRCTGQYIPTWRAILIKPDKISLDTTLHEFAHHYCSKKSGYNGHLKVFPNYLARVYRYGRKFLPKDRKEREVNNMTEVTKVSRYETAFNLIKENPTATFRELADKIGNKFTGGVKQSFEALKDCGAVSGTEKSFTVNQEAFDKAKDENRIVYVPKKPRAKKGTEEVVAEGTQS